MRQRTDGQADFVSVVLRLHDATYSKDLRDTVQYSSVRTDRIMPCCFDHTPRHINWTSSNGRIMIVAAELSKRIFIWGVAAVAVLPRQHIDRTRWSIGGKLSYSFRKFLLALVAINFVRLLLKDSSIKNQFQLLRDLLGTLQQVGNTFLCFLTPYLLQTWLAQLINIGGRPGASLMPTLYASTGLSALAAILARTVHPNAWFLRKIGNAISSLPVISTLKVFNSVTTHGGVHGGRGTILSQSLMVVEYWNVVGQILCAIGFAFDRHTKPDLYSQWDVLLDSFRDIAFVLDWTRILAHSLFINQLDELHLSQPPASSSNSNGSARNAAGPEMTRSDDASPFQNNRGIETVSLVNRSNQMV
jgi:hypothetical protein